MSLEFSVGSGVYLDQFVVQRAIVLYFFADIASPAAKFVVELFVRCEFLALESIGVDLMLLF